MPTHTRNKLLMQKDITTVTDLCSSVSKHLVMKYIFSDEEASTNGGNALLQISSSKKLAAATNSLTRAQTNLAAGQ